MFNNFPRNPAGRARLFALASAVALAATCFALSGPGVAQAIPDYRMRAQDFSARQDVVIHVSGNVHLVAGAGSNITVLTGADGLILVDGSYSQMNGKVVAALKQISDKPVRFLIDTHFHGDHTGANADFAKLGATVIASDATRARLQGETPSGSKPAPYAALVYVAPPPAGAPAAPPPGFGGSVAPAALPSLTLSHAMTLHMNGEDVTVMPAPAIEHTEGDLFVYFRGANVMSLGDDYTTDYPAINPAAGGTSQAAIDNWNAALDLGNPATKFIPGHGQISSRQDLIDLRDAVIAIREKIRALVAQGMTLDQVKAARPTQAWDARFAMENVGHNDVFSTDRWYNIMFAEAQQYQKDHR